MTELRDKFDQELADELELALLETVTWLRRIGQNHPSWTHRIERLEAALRMLRRMKDPE